MTFFFSKPPIPTQGKTLKFVTRMIANVTSKSALFAAWILENQKLKNICKKGHEEKKSNRRNIIIILFPSLFVAMRIWRTLKQNDIIK